MTSSQVSNRRDVILADVRGGLTRRPRELSPKYFYDERGSELFEEITRLPEYYLTRAERSILVARASEIAEATGARTMIELGAGSAAKTRILLDAFEARGERFTYMPVDVSEDFLERTGESLAREYPSLRISPIVADIDESLNVPANIERPVLFAFLGSTIGNFDGRGAVALLQRVRREMRPQDRLLLGTDLIKDEATLNAAYNDAAGVTAEFNRNILAVLNAELDADFDSSRWEHRAFYNVDAHRIEMHLHSIGDQVVTIPGLPSMRFTDGESLRTELSHKYDRGIVNSLGAKACLRVERWYTDDAERFALSLLAPV
jgi:L-histidine N-alpha-methyltransferase